MLYATSPSINCPMEKEICIKLEHSSLLEVSMNSRARKGKAFA